MQYFMNLSTRAKLAIGFGILILLLIGVSIKSIHDIDSLRQSQQTLYEDDLAIGLALMTMRNNINREAAILLLIPQVDNQTRAQLLAEHKVLRADLQQTVAELAKSAERDAVQRQSFEQLIQAKQQYGSMRDSLIMPLLANGQYEQAAQRIIQDLSPLGMELRGIAETLGNAQIDQAKQQLRNSLAVAESAEQALVVLDVIALVIALVFVLLMDRAIARPLTDANRLARQIASGNLTAAMPSSSRTDEVGQLLQSLGVMTTNLRDLMQEMNAGIVTLASAGSEILASTTQVTGGASESATAVNETTATVEEVKQTAYLSAQKARTVSEIAQRATSIATTGRTALDEANTGMATMREQVEAIAEAIIQLSGESQEIADIIETVGSLSEQSNLLAVNAAIEASKAGEHGIGFSVVAQEVKDLAAQSKAATKQVRKILSAIQKLISNAVMNVENGVKTVDSGVQRVEAAGNSIRSLAESIAEAAQAATQIAASSQQQLAGMDQVAVAMERIGQVTSENLAGAKQSEASARNLHDLGQRLRQLTEKFSL